MHDETCDYCKKVITVAIYFSNARITTHNNFEYPGTEYYKAHVNGKFICPLCGEINTKTYHRELCDSDIIELLKEKEQRGRF